MSPHSEGLLYGLLVALVLLLVIRWGLVVPLTRVAEWIRRLRAGEPMGEEALPTRGPLAPLTREIANLARSLILARHAAEEEARLRHARESRWTAERLKEQVRTLLGNRPMLVIANREPYQHVRRGRQIQCIVPASGLVTAMEPILRACGGTWIAHGSGDADRDTVDTHNRLRVPPEEPCYTLRRVWLSQEEEKGYYYGFANEGLWPLCHIAHTRPLFRAEDWAHYAAVNAKFAEAVLEELPQDDGALVLIQDYHFARLPTLIREKRPDAKIALFWHIPWPNAEAFAICPWARQLLQGMLGADLLGFHTQFHCNNFLETVDRMLESRIDWEQFTINQAGHTTWVKPFPISVAVQDTEAQPDTTPLSVAAARDQILRELGIRVQWLGVGVDRIDYTKGILERFRAIERFLEKHPALQGQFVFVELGAPSRTLIKRYEELETEVEAEAERINRRFQTAGWRPVLLFKKHHSHEEIDRYYRAADVCLVTSLHDGMNLVAKEFVATRADERGVLILSQFTGAARELQDALLVNPYDIDQVADAIYYALMMSAEEQKVRMARMREVLQEHNIYRWAATLITELAKLRPPAETLAAQTPTG